MNDLCKYIKYPRTCHLSFSQGIIKDDRILKDNSCFEDKRVIVLEKLDGENCSMYNDYLHARSIDGVNHPSRNWVKNFHAKMSHKIPEGWRVCGENMFAKHTIHYDNLESYFYCFSVWNEKNECLSWNDTIEWAKLLDIILVPVLYDGIWDVNIVKEFCNNDTREGFVVRITDSFSYIDFKKSVAKFVHNKFKNNLKNEDTFHWRYSKLVKNNLKK